MADNVVLNSGTGGPTIRTIDRTGIETQVINLDFGGETGPESLVTTTNPLPIAQTGALPTGSNTIGTVNLNNGSGSTVAPTTPLPISVNAANFIFSSVNSFVGQLNSGNSYTFAGTAETALNQPSISLLLTTDAIVTIIIHQYIDPAYTYEVTPISFIVNPATDFSRSFTLNGNYVNVVAISTSTANINLNVAYGTIGSADSSGNQPVALYGSDDVAVGTDIYNGTGYLHVDSSASGTDGYPYNNITFPQVTAVAGHGTDGLAHAISVSPTGAVIITEGGGSITVDSGLGSKPLNITSNIDTPIFSAIVGDPNGDFAGVNLLEAVMDTNSGLALNVNLATGISKDTSGALIPSDAPTLIKGAANGLNEILFQVDTTGYQSISIQVYGTWAGTFTLQSSNDAVNWVSATGWNVSSANAPITTFTSNLGVAVPVTLRYFRVQCTAYTSGVAFATAYLRQQPAFNTSATPSYNLAQVAGSGVSAASAQLGMNIVQVGGVATSNTGSAVTATSPAMPVAGTDSGLLARRLLTDTFGRAQIGNTTAINGVNSNPIVLVQDVGMYDGKSIPDLLYFILKELQIANQQRAESFGLDEPDGFRIDTSLFTLNS